MTDINKSDSFNFLSQQTKTNLEKFRSEVSNLTSSELKRLLIALTEYPVEASKDLTSQKEIELMNLGIRIKQDIFMMSLEYLATQKEEGAKNE